MIGVFGGTFDPVHYGHLRPTQDVMRELELTRVLFIPNNVPPHREPPWLNAEQRRQLLEIALQDYDNMVMDCRELERTGPSYMVDTLASLAVDYPQQGLCLILGLDAFAGFHHWHQWQHILDYAHLVITERPGYSWPEQAELATLAPRRVTSKAELEQSRAGKILLKSVSLLDISASDIRNRILSGENVTQFMPAAVAARLGEMIQTV